MNEAYVNTHDGKYIGKLHMKSLIFAKPSDAIIKYTDTEALNIKSDASLQQAIEAAANFIGETIAVVDRKTGKEAHWVKKILRNVIALVIPGVIFLEFVMKFITPKARFGDMIFDTEIREISNVQ